MAENEVPFNGASVTACTECDGLHIQFYEGDKIAFAIFCTPDGAESFVREITAALGRLKAGGPSASVN